MSHSQLTAAANAAVLHVKSRVKYRGLNTAGGWIRHPLDVSQKFVARIDSIVTGIVRDREYQRNPEQFSNKPNGELYVDELERLALETGTGNCSELSAVAFNQLRGQGIAPLDYFAVFRGSWDHAFVILNRDKSIPIADFKKWSYSAVLCDPLYDRVADAGFLATWYPKALPLTDKDVKLRFE